MRSVIGGLAISLFGILILYSLSELDLDSFVHSVSYDGAEKNKGFYLPDTATISKSSIDSNLVKIVKSFKNSSGFYKINGTLENQGAMILSDIKVIKYYKISLLNDAILVCYQQNIVNCEYKSNNDQLPPKNFFLTIPDKSYPKSN